MNSFLSLPVLFLTFWYLQAPKNIFLYFLSLNKAYMHQSSMPLFIRTFFQPWKNEYRDGLVGFSIGMGIFIKSIFLLAETVLFLLLVLVEIFLLILFLLWPVGTIALLFIKI